MTTRQRIVKELHARDINVPLYTVEHSTKGKEFRTSVRDNIFDSIKHIAQNHNRIRSLLMWTKNPQSSSKPSNSSHGKAAISSPILKVDPNQKLINEVSLALGSKTIGDVKIAAYLQWVGEQGGQSALDKLGIEGNFVMKNQDLLTYFDNYSNLLIDSVDETTKKWIAQQIQYGRENFLSPQEIAQRLVTEGQGISIVRAKMISVTESAKALTTVELKAMDSYGMEEKTWHTSEDEKVENICRDLDDKTIPLADEFDSEEGPVAGPPAHIACRCFLDYPLPDKWNVPTDPWLGE